MLAELRKPYHLLSSAFFKLTPVVAHFLGQFNTTNNPLMELLTNTGYKK